VHHRIEAQSSVTGYGIAALLELNCSRFSICNSEEGHSKLSSTNVATAGCAVDVQADQHCTMQLIAAQPRSNATGLLFMYILQHPSGRNGAAAMQQPREHK